MFKHCSLSILSVLSLAVGCSEPPPPPVLPRPVRTLQVASTQGTERLVQTGEVQPRRETDLAFQIDGRITRRYAEVSKTVRKGELIATLDAAIVTNEQRASQAEVASATSSLELAQASLTRMRELFAGASASQQQVDEATANFRAANARRNVALLTLQSADQKLGYARLLAEEAGVVTLVGANQGQFVSAGQMVVRVATIERDAVFAVAESVFSTAPADAKVRVALVSNPAVAVTGPVREISPSADPVTRTYNVRIALPDAPAELSYGAPVTGTLELPGGKLVELPASALTHEADSPAVYVVTPDTSLLERRRVEVARYDQTRVWLSSGLRSGERVVTAGVSQLRPQQQVTLESDAGHAL